MTEEAGSCQTRHGLKNVSLEKHHHFYYQTQKEGRIGITASGEQSAMLGTLPRDCYLHVA
jgi:hypothetical protein